jgi:hypothetical protein
LHTESSVSASPRAPAAVTNWQNASSSIEGGGGGAKGGGLGLGEGGAGGGLGEAGGAASVAGDASAAGAGGGLLGMLRICVTTEPSPSIEGGDGASSGGSGGRGGSGGDEGGGVLSSGTAARSWRLEDTAGVAVEGA